MTVKDKCALATKPIAWSNNGFTGPSSPKVSSGYVHENGYGGEEWNNASNRDHNGERIFHTETKPKLNAYAEKGNLGLIMTSWSNKRQFIVGVACGVRRLMDSEKVEIGKNLGAKSDGNYVWQQVGVQERFESRAAFDRHWRDGNHTITWACPSDLYHWFKVPIMLQLNPLGGKGFLAKMHNGYQAILPEQGLELLHKNLGLDSPIRDWLMGNEFDAGFLNPKHYGSKASQSVEERRKNYGSPTPQAAYDRYIREAIIKVHPKHNLLEAEYRDHLKRQGVLASLQNDRGMDFFYDHPEHGRCIAELKPCEAGETRYAIRHALGQLFEYRYHQEPSAKIITVLSVEPSEDEKAYLKSLNVGCAWPSDSGFQERWPGN